MKLYKITTTQLWEASQGQDALQLSPTDQAFIHFSEEEDVQRIRAKFFADHEQVVLAEVDSDQLPGQLRYEANKPGGKKYYHLYDGAIPLTAVVRISTLPKEPSLEV